MKRVLYVLILIAALSGITSSSFGDNNAVITIYNPSSGVEWVRGYTYNITWYYGYTYGVNIDLIGPGGTVNLATNTPNTGIYPWLIPSGQTPGTYQIRITSFHNPASTATATLVTSAAPSNCRPFMLASGKASPGRCSDNNARISLSCVIARQCNRTAVALSRHAFDSRARR